VPSGSGMWTYPPIVSGSAWNALLAEGIINIGASFPATAIEGKMYWRTDLQSMYIRSGSSWNDCPNWNAIPTANFTGSVYTNKHIFVYTTGSDMNVNDLLDVLWHYDGSGSAATWDATSYLVPTGSHGLLRWVDDTGYGAGGFMDLIFIRSSNEPSNPNLYCSQHVIAKKDFACGGLVSSNQGALYLGSGFTAINDPPQIILSHSGTGDYTKYGSVKKNKLRIVDMSGNYGDLMVGNITGSGHIQVAGFVSGSAIFNNNYSGSGDLTVAGVISGSSYLGIPSSYVQAGQLSMNGNVGTGSVVFDNEFSGTPYVVATIQDVYGLLQRSVTIIAKSATGFTAQVNIGQHMHTGSGNVAAEGSHTHSAVGTTGVGSEHDHSSVGQTGGGSGHKHVISGGVGAGSAHTHTIAGGDGAHPHTPGNESSHTHSHNHAVGGITGLTYSGWPYDHTHSSGGPGVEETDIDATSGTAHTHAIGGADGTHSHSPGNESSHTHTDTIDTNNESSHYHSYANTTSTGSAHDHYYANTTGTGSSHLHAMGNVTVSGSFGVAHDSVCDWIAVGSGYA